MKVVQDPNQPQEAPQGEIVSTRPMKRPPGAMAIPGLNAATAADELQNKRQQMRAAENAKKQKEDIQMQSIVVW